MKFLKYIGFVGLLAVISFFLFNEKEITSDKRPIPKYLSEDIQEDYRKLPFSGANNFRDLGGYTTKEGRKIRWGKIYRSDNLHSLTDEDVNYFERLNIKSVIDFRSEGERTNEPDRLPQETKQILLPIVFQPQEVTSGAIAIDDLMKAMTFGEIDSSNLLRDFNIELVKTFTEEYRQFVRYLIDNNGEPLVFHCTAGKDRAGFASALILSILGVPHDKVVEDYMMTNQYVGDYVNSSMRKIEMKTFFRADSDNLRKIYLVEERYIQAAFDAIDNHWGGMDRYLSEGLNLNENDIEKLRSIYLE